MSEPIRLSVSKTKTYLDCKKKFKFAYVLKLPKVDHDYHIFGKFNHKVLEDYHNLYINGSTEDPASSMNSAFKSALKEYKAQMTKEQIKDSWDIINNYLSIITNDKSHNLSVPVLACEKQFEVPLDDKVVLNGMIDRVQLDPDGVLHVCDYKTSKSDQYLKKDFFQLLTYAFVLYSEDNSIKKVRASYIMLKHKFKYITTEFEIKDILKAKDKYLEYGEKIVNENEYAPNPTRLCSYCDYINDCPQGKTMVDTSKVFGEVSW